jgi:hypothetical protein
MPCFRYAYPARIWPGSSNVLDFLIAMDAERRILRSRRHDTKAILAGLLSRTPDSLAGIFIKTL